MSLHGGREKSHFESFVTMKIDRIANLPSVEPLFGNHEQA